MNRTAIRLEARRLMKCSEPKPMLVSLVYVLILIVLSILSFELFGRYIIAFFQSLTQGLDMSSEESFNKSLMSFYASMDPESLMYELENALPSMASRLLYILLIITGVLVSSGFVIFCMNTASGNFPDLGNLFDGFALFLRIICLVVLEALFIFMWSTLFFFPGIIAFYRYRMALYIMLEYPELGPLRCIMESSRMMKGHKGELFGLDLSFIGWFLLVYITNILGASTGIAILSIVGLGYIVYIPLMPYLNLTWVLFYRQLAKNYSPLMIDNA